MKPLRALLFCVILVGCDGAGHDVQGQPDLDVTLGSDDLQAGIGRLCAPSIVKTRTRKYFMTM
jgi:hypothetical protein